MKAFKPTQKCEPMLAKRSWKWSFMGVCSALVLCCMTEEYLSGGRLLALATKPNSFGYTEISETAPLFTTFPPHLLVFDGHKFDVFNIAKNGTYYITGQEASCGRCDLIVPLMIHALKELDPSRFEPGQPVFQLLFSTADSSASVCVNPGKCQVDKMAPLLLYGSSPVDEQELPQVYGLPNWFYIKCIYEYKMQGVDTCSWTETIIDDVPWDSLIDTIIWRGSDFSFLAEYDNFQRMQKNHVDVAKSIDLANINSTRQAVDALYEHWDDLLPRWKGAALTVKSEMEDDEHWIDIKFTGEHKSEARKKFAALGVHVSSPWKMSPEEMSRYKYQIDLGGGGGTSWRGTLSKLGMPGVLFHHNTLTKDWFFDEMEPWVHYIPVSTDLSDLGQRYGWAQENPTEVRAIAKASTDLHDYMMSKQYMKKIYEEDLMDTLREVMRVQVSPEETWEELKKEFEKEEFSVTRYITCDVETEECSRLAR